VAKNSPLIKNTGRKLPLLYGKTPGIPLQGPIIYTIKLYAGNNTYMSIYWISSNGIIW
jgi:hypothetical protein